MFIFANLLNAVAIIIHYAAEHLYVADSGAGCSLLGEPGPVQPDS